MLVEELVTKLGLEVDSKALSVLEKFRSSITGGLLGISTLVGGLSGAFAAMVHSVAMTGDEVDTTATALGTTAQALQEYQHAAEMSDVSNESLATSLKFVTKNAVEAANGGKEAAEAFAGIGIRDAEGKIKKPTELLRSAFDVLRQMPNESERNARAIKIFGRSGLDIVPMFTKTNAQLDAFIQEAHDLGLVLSDDVVAAGSDFDDAMKRVQGSIRGLRNTFAGPFVRKFADALAALVPLIVKLQPLAKDLSDAFMDLGKRLSLFFKVVLSMVSAVRESTGIFGEWVTSIVGSVKWLKIIEAALIGMGVVFVAVAAQAIGAWLAAAAPFVLLAALIGLITDDIFNFIAGNDSLIGRIVKWADAIGDPDEHPVVKMLRKALALLLDFTDPAHWNAFKNAAGDAVDYVNEKIRAALGFAKNNQGQLSGNVFGQGVLPYIKPPANFSGGQIYSPGPNFSAEHAPAPNHSGPVVNITVNGTHLSGEELQSRIKTGAQEALDASYSKSYSAASGGEH